MVRKRNPPVPVLDWARWGPLQSQCPPIGEAMPASKPIRSGDLDRVAVKALEKGRDRHWVARRASRPISSDSWPTNRCRRARPRRGTGSANTCGETEGL